MRFTDEIFVFGWELTAVGRVLKIFKSTKQKDPIYAGERQNRDM